jgi:hypothetical protein
MAFPCKIRVTYCTGKEVAPDWAIEFATLVWNDWIGPRVKRPKIFFTCRRRGATEADYGGRWMPTKWAIGICKTPNRSINRAVLLHEMAHAILAARGHTLYGTHSQKFAGLVHALYSQYRVPRRIAEQFDPEIWM